MKLVLKVLLMAAAGALLAGRPVEDGPVRVPVILNQTLENGMSDAPGLDALDASIDDFLKHWNIHGASLAIMRNDSLVYAKGYGGNSGYDFNVAIYGRKK